MTGRSALGGLGVGLDLAVSAFSSLASTFFAFFMARSIFAPMSDTPTTTSPACPASRCSPSSLRSWRLMPAAA